MLLVAAGLAAAVVVTMATWFNSPRSKTATTRVRSAELTLPGRPPHLRIWYPEPSPTQPPSPVVLYSPGWGRTDCENTRLCEFLASHGFAVLATDHPPSSPDGRLEDFDLSTDAAAAAFARGAQREVSARAADLQRLMDLLPELNSGALGKGQLAGRLDPTRIGIVGFSFGGAVAAETIRLDQRVGAAVNLDGALFGASQHAGTSRPVLFITDDLPPPSEKDLTSPDAASRRFAEFTATAFQAYSLWEKHFGARIVRIPGATHEDFQDGSDDPPAAKRRDQVRSEVLAFLTKHLMPGKS